MLLVIGIDGDHTFHHMLRRCTALDFPFLPINLRAVVQRGTWILPISKQADTGWVDIDGDIIELNPQRDYFCRLINMAPITRLAGLSHRWTHLVSSLSAWLEMCSGRVINRPGHMVHNGLKPTHEGYLSKAGFLVPASITSSNPHLLKEFCRAGPTIVKSLSGARADAKQVSETCLEKYNPLSGPLHLQRLISGDDIRVHVVGNEVLAVQIKSSAIDYRNSLVPNLYRPYHVSDKLRSCLLRSTRAQGLVIAGWDFKEDKDGRLWCLECNPMPGFSSYDLHLDCAISASIIDCFSRDIPPPIASSQTK